MAKPVVTFRAGDQVRHASGDTYVIGCTLGLYAIGESHARLDLQTDLTMVKPATDVEHVSYLVDVLRRGKRDCIYYHARRKLTDLYGAEAGAPSSVLFPDIGDARRAGYRWYNRLWFELRYALTLTRHRLWIMTEGQSADEKER